jgi:hypothetical protein
MRTRPLSLAALLGLCACSGAPGGGEPLLVGAAAVDITPVVETFEDSDGDGRYDAGEKFTDRNGNGKWDPVYLAGFGMNRTALGVHDRLWARGVLFEKGGRRVLFVSCDLVGLLHVRIRRIRAKIAGIENVVISSTHVHSGPDTVGLWGPFPGVPGVSEEYLGRLEAAIVECAERAMKARAPARLSAAETRVEGVCKDTRAPDVRNEVASALLARGTDGRPLAVLASFAMHPEGIWSRNRLVSSDYPHYVREALERGFPGATAVFVSADLGGMQTPDVKAHTWEEIERCGVTIAARVKEALEGAPELAVPEVRFARAPVEFALENARFVAGLKAGVFGKDTEGVVREEEGRVTLVSEVAAARLGEAMIVTLPGEALPEVGREVLELMRARHRMLVGLAQDEIGYILPKEGFDPKKYEESMSLGPRTAPTLLDALKQLLKDF